MPSQKLCLILGGLLVAALAGCRVDVNGDNFAHTGETVKETQSVPLAQAQGVDRLRVDVELHAGELRVESGAKELMEGEFSYNVPSWKPDVRFERSGFRGTLSIKQGGASGNVGHTTNIWELKLNDTLPVDFALRCGAGESRLNLGQLDVRGVDVHLGAGRVELDLTGRPPKHDYSVSINGGVGEALVRLPSDAGVIASASGGIGDIEVFGLQKEGSEWRNGPSGKGKPTIHLDVHGGIGKITIDAR